MTDPIDHLNKIVAGATTPKTDYTEKTNEYVNQIFKQLRVIFPSWKNNMSGSAQEWGNDQKALLRDMLISKNIHTAEQINAGLDAAADHSAMSPFMPTMGLFVEWCDPKHVPKVPYHAEPPAEPVKALPRTVESVERSKLIGQWYARRIAEISAGDPVDYDEPQTWKGAITPTAHHPESDLYTEPEVQHAHDQALKRMCFKKRVPYFAPNGGIELFSANIDRTTG